MNALTPNFNHEIKIVNRFVREAECKSITGLSRTRRWELEKEGKFPKRIKLGERGIKGDKNRSIRDSNAG